MSQTENDLIRQLERFRDTEDRGALASLRRGLGQPPGEVAETGRVVERMLHDDDSAATREALYVLGPLFALYDDAPIPHGRWDNMGDHFRALCEAGKDPPSNVERRFMALLMSEPDDLPDALRQAMSLLKAGNAPVNWRQLFRDVRGWRSPEARRNSRERWSKSFWAQREPKPTGGNASASDAEPDESTTA